MMNRIVARRDFVKMGLLAGATMTTGGLLSACASNGEGAASQSADGLGVGSSSGANQAVQADPRHATATRRGQGSCGVLLGAGPYTCCS